MILDNGYIKKLEEENLELRYKLERMKNMTEPSVEDMQSIPDRKLLKKKHFDLASRDFMYRMIIESMSEGTVVINSKHTIVYSNKHFSDFVGYPLQKVFGANFKTFIDKNSTEIFLKCLTHSKNQKTYCEINLINPYSTEKLFLTSASSFFIENETYYIILLTDISFHKHIKEGLESEMAEQAAELAVSYSHLNEKNKELQEINKYLDNFVHAIAHDLRGPVSNLKLIENVMDKAPEEDRKKLLLSIFKNIDKLDITLHGLVEIINAQGKSEMNLPDIDIIQIVNEVLMEEKEKIESLNAEIIINKNTNEKINYIRVYIKSVARNLISNALKYYKPDERLRLEITLKKSDEFFILSFKDNGIGIDLSRQNKNLFKPFQRFSSNTNGLGIGLSIINIMVLKNGGYINVESNPGKGSAFTVYLKEYKT